MVNCQMTPKWLLNFGAYSIGKTARHPNYKKTINKTINQTIISKNYIAHSARNSFGRFFWLQTATARAPANGFAWKIEEMISEFRSIFSKHQNANPGTYSRTFWLFCREKHICLWFSYVFSRNLRPKRRKCIIPEKSYIFFRGASF